MNRVYGDLSNDYFYNNGLHLKVDIARSGDFKKLIKNCPHIVTEAIIDSGTTQTCILKGIAQKLDLSPFDTANISGFTESKKCDKYTIDFNIIGSKIFIYDTMVIEAPMPYAKYGMIIGRDIIKETRLIYDGFNGTMSWEFK